MPIDLLRYTLRRIGGARRTIEMTDYSLGLLAKASKDEWNVEVGNGPDASIVSMPSFHPRDIPGLRLDLDSSYRPPVGPANTTVTAAYNAFTGEALTVAGSPIVIAELNKTYP